MRYRSMSLPKRGCKFFQKADLSGYDDAIKALNGLQSNASVIKNGSKTGPQLLNRSTTEKYIKRCGMEVDKFEKEIPTIHVSGTKGKGSTCALCESIIRFHGYKTGLFTSPHIINVRERIKINGVPLSPSEFSDNFWPIYNTLLNNKEYEDDMPPYFKFLTVMAFSVFLKEKVDVAIFEVGIGGEHDCTNVFRRTPIVGITSLGLDHTKILGETLDSIAWQKAGIIKNGCATFTIEGHDPSALKVIQERAEERNSRLTLVPSLNDYSWDANHLGPIHNLNASLAVQLAHAWIKLKNNLSWDGLPTSTVDETTKAALMDCHILGRFQIVPRGAHVYYLDGAHTKESAEYCSSWFSSNCAKGKKKTLVFNLTYNRDALKLLPPFTKCGFDQVIFSPNNINSSQNSSPKDLFDLRASMICVQDTLEGFKQAWIELTKTSGDNVFISSSVSETINLIESNNEPNQILVTGSLHLVGSVLTHFLPQGGV